MVTLNREATESKGTNFFEEFSINCVIIFVNIIAGLVRDVTNSYPVCINTLNGLPTFACIIPWILEYAVLHMKAKSSEKEES
jgi:hypothetical protein